MVESYGIDESSQNPEDLFAGPLQRVEKPVTIKTGSGSLLRGTLLGRQISDGKYVPIDPGTAYTDEDRGDGDASTKNFSGTLAHPGVKPGSLVIAAVVVGGATETFTDNGDGTMTSDGATPGSGTINYATGAYDVTFFVAPDTGEDILAAYVGALSAHAAEAIGTGTAGGQVEWRGFLASTEVVPRSLYIYTNDTTPKLLHDDGHGNIVGDYGHGAINYETGEYEIVFDAAPADTKLIKADYCSTDGADVCRCVLGRAVDATSAEVNAFGFFTGEFNRGYVTWPTGTSEAQKDEIANKAAESNLHIKKLIT